MILKKSLRNLLLVVTLTLLFLTSTNILAQEVSLPSVVITLEPIDSKSLQEIDRCFQEREKMEGLISEYVGEVTDLKNRLNTEIDTNKLSERELDLQKRVIELKDQEIKFLKDSFDRMKDIADRALKLSGDKSTIQQILEWVIRIAIFTAAYFLAK